MDHTSVLENVVISYSIHIALYLGIGVLFLLVDDYLNSHNTWNFYKNSIRRHYDTNLREVLRVIFINELFNFFMTWMMYYVFMWNLNNNDIYQVTMPYYGIWYTIIGILILEDIFFYTCHRLLHTKYFYNFHATHHEFIHPYALTAIYASPIEHIFSNLLPIFASSLVMKLNWFHLEIFMTIATVNTLIVHSGYKISKFHYKHHMLFNKNYGVLGIMDRIFGTYK
jgi:sterol desaturase/sphingolipid hydroxylase (fatty acid hydroxylase superfamily)